MIRFKIQYQGLIIGIFFPLIIYSQTDGLKSTIDGNNFLKDYYHKIIQKRNINTNSCFYIILNGDDINPFQSNTLEAPYQENTFIKNANSLFSQNFKHPLTIQFENLAWGDSSRVTLRMRTRVNCEQSFLGKIKIKYRGNQFLPMIIQQNFTSEIPISDLIDFLVDKDVGICKLLCYRVNMTLEMCHGAEILLMNSFFSFEKY